MHVLVYFDDRIRETCLRQAWSYANVQSLDSFELTESQLKADVLIIDVHQENISDISELVERVRAHSQMNVIALFATEQSISKQWSRYLISQSVFLLQANQIDHQTIQSLQSLLSSSHDREKSIASKTVLFTGTTPNIGTTVVAFGTALQLATRTDKSLAYICLNLKSSKIHHYIGIEHPSIDRKS